MNCALLLSGGIDSTAIAWWLRPGTAITVDYGQLAAKAEITAAERICKELEIVHHVIRADCRALGSGDLAGTAADSHAYATDWWPYRNQLLVTLAAMTALAHRIPRIMLGTVHSDRAHRDGTDEFVSSMSNLLSLQEGGLIVEAPAINMTTRALIRTAEVPARFLSWAHSCHVSDVTCGGCRGCNKYFEVMSEVAQ